MLGFCETSVQAKIFLMNFMVSFHYKSCGEIIVTEWRY